MSWSLTETFESHRRTSNSTASNFKLHSLHPPKDRKRVSGMFGNLCENQISSINQLLSSHGKDKRSLRAERKGNKNQERSISFFSPLCATQ